MKLKKHQEDKNGDSVKERAGIKASGTWRELNAGLRTVEDLSVRNSVLNQCQCIVSVTGAGRLPEWFSCGHQIVRCMWPLRKLTTVSNDFFCCF